MSDSSINVAGNIGGKTLSGSISRSANYQSGHEIDIPVAEGGTLSTRTSDTAGTVTMDDAGHSISNGDTIDIYWTDANGALMCAAGATVGTVAGTSVPFTGASGDALPAASSTVTVSIQVEKEIVLVGNDIEHIIAICNRACRFEFVDSVPASLLTQKSLADEPWQWYANSGTTNPLAGDTTDKLIVSNSDKNNAAVFDLGVLHN